MRSKVAAGFALFLSVGLFCRPCLLVALLLLPLLLGPAFLFGFMLFTLLFVLLPPGLGLLLGLG